MESEFLSEKSNLFEMTAQGLRFGDQIVCGQFEVMGLARTPLSESWSTVLRFVDRDKKEHQLFISANELLDAKTLIERLVGNGLMVRAPNKREKIVEFISSHNTAERFLILDTSGWQNEGFYLPYSNEFIGKKNEKTINKFKQQHSIAKNKRQGSLEEWNERLGYLLEDNSNLILATSTVLAAPLLKPLNKQNYGFNFLGKSSIGKSTLLEFAASIVGSSNKGAENYLCNFRTTDNALESVGWGHSDMCLMLDEFGQLDPYKVKDVVYLLGNGCTKGRSSKSGEANERKSFSITYLSSAEVSLITTLAQIGQKTKSGLEVRFIDIDAEVDSGQGCYENLHGFNNGKELSDYIKKETKKTYGSLFDAFIRLLVERSIEGEDEFTNKIQNWCNDFIKANSVSDNPITNRIVSSIAINYAAMMFAIENRLVDLNSSNLIVCLQKVIHSISEKFGESHNEENQIIESIIDFIQANEKSRFDSDDFNNFRVANRVGFIKEINGEKFYCVFGHSLKKDICPSWSPRQITNALEKRGFIRRNPQDKFSHLLNFGNDALRAYPINAKILEYDI
jgi:hypothetical protein